MKTTTYLATDRGLMVIAGMEGALFTVELLATDYSWAKTEAHMDKSDSFTEPNVTALASSRSGSLAGRHIALIDRQRLMKFDNSSRRVLAWQPSKGFQ